MDDRQVQYVPAPRWGHASVAIGNKVYIWGGRTNDFSEAQKKKVLYIYILLNKSIIFGCVLITQ